MSIVDDLKQSHEDILQAIGGLTKEELERPGTIGTWSIRDSLLHIAMWEGEVLKAFAIWRSGQEVDWSYVGDMKSILRFNDFWIENMKYLSVEKILALLDQVHTAISKLRELSPLWDMYKEGIDLSKVQWAAH